MKKSIILFLLLLNITYSNAKYSDSSDVAPETQIDTLLLQNLVKIDSSFQTGTVEIGDNLAKINVPPGYKFLNAELSRYVLNKLWGNPPNESTLGLLFPENIGPLSDNFTFAVEITYSEEGYIEDDDAKDLDYDDLLEEMQKDAEEANPERVKQGYGEIHLIRWAETPFYDEQTKKLYWAKELKFGTDSSNTLNYNIRILGRKGYLNLNVIGDMSVLPEVKKDIQKIIASAEFSEGNKYSDFNPDIDKIAAYGIGGLIAGKLLAKAGFFLVLLKFWKVIAIGVAAFGAGIWKKFFGGKTEDETRDSTRK